MSLNPEKYQAFTKLIHEVREYITATPIDGTHLQQRTASLQQFFLEQIVPLADTDSGSDYEGRIQSYHTEMSKQLRLLEIDVMFFQGARQASTAKDRLDAINNRLTTLIEYCNAILQ
jgi:hypothetical protein